MRRPVTALVLALTLSGSGLAAACSDPSSEPPAPAPQSAPPAPPASAVGGWQRLAPGLSQRTEVAAAAAGSRIVVAGGYRGDGATVSTVEILDTASGRWERGPDLPVPVNHAMAATVGDRVYVFGGYLSSNRPTDVAFTLDAGQWRQIAPLPQPRAAGTAASVGDTVYVAGGIGPNGLAGDMLVYDAVGDRWSTAPGPPTRREHLGGAAFGGLVYTVGGRTGSVDTNLAAFEAYDPRTSVWTRLPDLPTRRGGLAATATCTGLIIAVGGEAAATFPEVEAYEIQSRAWKTLPPLPTPRHGLGVVALGNKVYTLSGGPKPGLHVADSTEAIEVAGPCP
jgi:Kelch motif/Galactose oxidase, central domain